MLILIFPWAAKTTDGLKSAKDYPFWPELIMKLALAGHKIIQVSRAGELDVPGVSRRINDLKLSEIANLMRRTDIWISVDSFAQHLGWSIGKNGIVLFGPSSPEIFGHPENTNILKDRKYLREKQFWWWSQCPYNPEAFVNADEVSAIVCKKVEPKFRGKNER